MNKSPIQSPIFLVDTAGRRVAYAAMQGYLRAHRKRRADFAQAGATSTDHGHPTAATADLSTAEAERLFERVLAGAVSAADAEWFRAAMLVEMARMRNVLQQQPQRG